MPNSGYGTMAAKTTVSIRYGREVGSIMLVYLIALAYAPSCPLILPFTLVCPPGDHAPAWLPGLCMNRGRAATVPEAGGRRWSAVCFSAAMAGLFSSPSLLQDYLTTTTTTNTTGTLSSV